MQNPRLMPGFMHGPNDMRADETSAASDQGFHHTPASRSKGSSTNGAPLHKVCKLRFT